MTEKPSLGKLSPTIYKPQFVADSSDDKPVHSIKAKPFFIEWKSEQESKAIAVLSSITSIKSLDEIIRYLRRGYEYSSSEAARQYPHVSITSENHSFVYNGNEIKIVRSSFVPSIGMPLSITVNNKDIYYAHITPGAPWLELQKIADWLSLVLADGYFVTTNQEDTISVTSPEWSVRVQFTNFGFVKYEDGLAFVLEQFPESDRELVRKVYLGKVRKNMFFGAPEADSETFSGMAGRLPGVRRQVKNPVSGVVGTLMHTIINLNDDKKWTREQIADWIETLDDVPVFEVRAEQQDEYTFMGKVTQVSAIKRVRQSTSDK